MYKIGIFIGLLACIGACSGKKEESTSAVSPRGFRAWLDTTFDARCTFSFLHASPRDNPTTALVKATVKKVHTKAITKIDALKFTKREAGWTCYASEASNTAGCDNVMRYCEKEEKPSAGLAAFGAWLGKTFDRCTLVAVSATPAVSPITAVAKAHVTGRPGQTSDPNRRWLFEKLFFSREKSGWTCYGGSAKNTLGCEVTMMHCAAPEPIPDAAKRMTKAQAKKQMPKCMRAARRLIKAGQRCGINMKKYRAERICAEYKHRDLFTDKQAAGRLTSFAKPMGTQTQCQGIRVVVRGDRI